MDRILVDNKIYRDLDFKKKPLKKGEYEDCKFNGCDLSNTDLADIKFVDCKFTACDLSLAKVTNTAFRGVTFRGCKMLGLRFDTCNEFGLSFSFDDCSLNHSTFFQTKLRKTGFKDSQMHEVDFAGCDLAGAVFDNTIIEKTDFRTSYNYSIDPENNRMKKAMFSIPGVVGLLDKYDILIGGRG